MSDALVLAAVVAVAAALAAIIWARTIVAPHGWFFLLPGEKFCLTVSYSFSSEPAAAAFLRQVVEYPSSSGNLEQKVAVGRTLVHVKVRFTSNLGRIRSYLAKMDTTAKEHGGSKLLSAGVFKESPAPTSANDAA
jgi:hypothetical protein